MRVKTIIGALCVVFAVTGCRSVKDDPTGIILVGSPEVSTRERLVNDRLTQDGWLRKQLTAADNVSFDDFQGLLDERTLTALSVNATINANPNDLALQKAKSANDLQAAEEAGELSSLDHEIAVLEKQKRIAELQSGTSAAGQAGGNTTQPATTTPATTPAQTDLAGTLLTRLGSSERAGLPDPSQITTTRTKSSPIEALRDRLAYREEIRNEILENQLDDRHDLAGNTLYRFNIDATLIPSANNSAWGVVDVVVENFDKRLTSDLYGEWVPAFQRHFEREVNSQFVRMTRCLGDLSGVLPAATKCGLGTGEMEELLAYGSKIVGYYASPAAMPYAARTYEQQVKFDLRGLLQYIAGSDKDVPQRKALEVLIAKKVRADYFERYRLGAYLPRPAIGEETCREGEAKGGRIVKWCAAPALTGDPETDSPHYDCVKAVRSREDAKSRRGLREIRFECALSESWHVYAYAATPKDSVQRISRLAAARNTLELAAAISALTGAASINTAMAFIRDNQKMMQTILREPLIVGYTEAGKAAGDDLYKAALDKANFGWVIGPRFGLAQKPFRGEVVNMDHRPIQNSLAAAISLPAWSNRAKVTVRTCWKPKRAIEGKSDQRCGSTADERFHFVELPGRIDAIHNLLVNRAEPMPQGWENYEVVTGARAALLIKGTNLWRSTEVTLGAQTADEIRVLPDMTGIIARFDRVQEPASLDGGLPRTVEVNIWTSGGNQAVGEAKIYPQKKSDAAWKIAWRKPRLIKDEEIALELLDGALPPSFAKMDLIVEGFDTGNAKWLEPVRFTGTARDKVVVAKLTDIPGLSSGAEVRGSIWTLLRPDSVAVDLKATADGNAVYYANAGDAKIKTPANVKAGGKLTFTFPKRVTQAFPGFQHPRASATAPSNAELKDEKWSTNADGQEVLEYTVTITGPLDLATNPKLTVKLGPLADGLLADKLEFPFVP
jgi:hypothetical protein